MLKNPKDINFAYFGGGSLGVLILDELKDKGFKPTLLVTTPDKPSGRNLILTAPEVKVWAERENIPFIQPDSLKNFNIEEIKKYFKEDADIFIVASYGKIIPI